jgi:hypothetical protein
MLLKVLTTDIWNITILQEVNSESKVWYVTALFIMQISMETHAFPFYSLNYMYHYMLIIFG